MPSLLIIPETCTNVNTSVYSFCIPKREPCLLNPLDGLLVPCGEEWNCNRCQGDEEYNIPFATGDKIQVQTLFFDAYNDNRTTPTAGWGEFITATLCTESGDYNALDFASRSMVGYGCGRSYQIIELDTSLFTESCFKLRFDTFGSDGEPIDSICTQYYKREDLCVDTVLLQGKRDGLDCWGFCYDNPDSYVGDLIKYDTSIRIHGYFKADGGSVTFSQTGNRITKEVVRDTYTLQLGKKVPPFMEKIIRKQILGSKTICVDGRDFETESFTITNELESTRMMLFSVSLYEDCENTSGGCGI